MHKVSENQICSMYRITARGVRTVRNEWCLVHLNDMTSPPSRSRKLSDSRAGRAGGWRGQCMFGAHTVNPVISRDRSVSLQVTRPFLSDGVRCGRRYLTPPSPAPSAPPPALLVLRPSARWEGPDVPGHSMGSDNAGKGFQIGPVNVQSNHCC